jgi:Spy/CpxP family protein refolding chaperone
MITWKATLVFLGIFITGVVTGGFFGMRVSCDSKHKKTETTAHSAPAPKRPIDDWSKRKHKEFVTRLSLTPEQQEKFEPFFQKAQTEFRRLREQSFQQTSEITDRLDAQLRDLLTPGQRVELEKMIQERKEKYKKAEAERAGRGERPLSRKAE